MGARAEGERDRETELDGLLLRDLCSALSVESWHRDQPTVPLGCESASAKGSAGMTLDKACPAGHLQATCSLQGIALWPPGSQQLFFPPLF